MISIVLGTRPEIIKMAPVINEFKKNNITVSFEPVSDLAILNKKISGNAQSRKRNFFLHHGTFLYNFDIKIISRYLKIPSKEPVYRKKRSHEDFLANIPAASGKLKKMLAKALKDLA